MRTLYPVLSQSISVVCDKTLFFTFYFILSYLILFAIKKLQRNCNYLIKFAENREKRMREPNKNHGACKLRFAHKKHNMTKFVHVH